MNLEGISEDDIIDVCLPRANLRSVKQQSRRCVQRVLKLVTSLVRNGVKIFHNAKISLGIRDFHIASASIATNCKK